ncbi:hypothetical protein ACE6H2_002628 [Prunus campanulata]
MKRLCCNGWIMAGSNPCNYNLQAEVVSVLRVERAPATWKSSQSPMYNFDPIPLRVHCHLEAITYQCSHVMRLKAWPRILVCVGGKPTHIGVVMTAVKRKHSKF